MIWIAGGAVLLTVLINLAIVAFMNGKLEQRMSNVEKIQDRHESAHGHHYDQAREHETADQMHFKDNDRHWAPQERGWLNQRFIEVGQRFDKLESLIRENK